MWLSAKDEDQAHSDKPVYHEMGNPKSLPLALD
jgi:hypothetical protein